MPTAADFWPNLIGFQAAWWACALFGDSGALLAFAWLLGHLGLHPRRLFEMRVVLAAGTIGCLVDVALSTSGWLVFSTSSGHLPFWLIVLWGCFAATLNNSLKFLQGRLYLAALLGGIGGPLSYYAGAELGRLGFGSTLTSLLVLAAVWALLLPALLKLAQRLSPPAFAHQGVTS